MLQKLINSLSFLTVIPLPASLYAKEDCRAAAVCFPVVGAVIGIILYIMAHILTWLFPAYLAAALSVALLVKITGALHIDGLADTADGFFSGREKSRILEIMKDSCIGTMGATAVILVLVINIISLVGSGEYFARALLLAPICARAGMIFVYVLIPCARPGGIGQNMVEQAPIEKCIMLATGAVLLCAVLGGAKLVIAALASFAAIALLGYFATKKIGGYTGDVLGACIELGQMWFFIICAAK